MLAISFGFDVKGLQVNLVDIDSTSDEERLSGKNKEQFVEKVEEKTGKILASGFDPRIGLTMTDA